MPKSIERQSRRRIATFAIGDETAAMTLRMRITMPRSAA